MRRRWLLFALRWLTRAFFLGGVACVSWLFVVWNDATFYQLTAKTQLQQTVLAVPGVVHPQLPPSLRPRESVVGLLGVPRLDVSVVVVEGDDDQMLRVAVGHLPETPLPWEVGNASMAGHRDTFFRALRSLRVGDDIRMATTRGIFAYRVSRMIIVDPHDVSVLRPGDDTALTLITCYPFTYAGNAPFRFVVQATRAAGVTE
jgi:LPXTG-site transpeptidase (sortase) family protein